MTIHRSFGRQILCALVLALTVPSGAMSQEENTVPRPFVEEFLDSGVDVRMAQRVAFLEEIDAASRRWKEEYEGVKTYADIEARQKRQRDYFLSALGPMWERTPLNAKITGRGEKENFRYENILFESVPGTRKMAKSMILIRASAYLPPSTGSRRLSWIRSIKGKDFNI